MGIPPEDLPRVFDRFYRVDKARSRKLGGSGLGLSIAQWIARAHGGDVNVTSKVGEGSIFRIMLPVFSKADYSSVEAAATSRRKPRALLETNR
jgi:two-component system sensor histidine kinase VicK